jgi:hypothetical protein
VLALECARQCREVNARLTKIALMLDGGGEIQALQLAEQPPPVVDVALALSFGGELAWQDYCQAHGHEVAPVVDARSLERLLAAQSKGIAPNHPLYRDYRAAVSSRDDERALNLIRVIARLNPGDENAAKELQRLQRKALQAALVELRENIYADPDSLLAAMQHVEAIGTAEDYENLPDWQEAIDRRRQIERAAAWQRMPELLRQAEQQLANGAWRQAAVLHGEFGMLAGIHGFNEATAGLAKQAQAIGEELNEYRAESTRTAEVKRLVAEMDRLAGKIATQAQMSGGVPLESAVQWLDELTRKLRQHEAVGGEFPEPEAQQRITAAKAILTQTVASSKRRKHLRFAVLLTSAVAVLLVIGGYSVLAWRASNQTALIASLHRDQSVSGLRETINNIRQNEPLLLKFSGLATELAQANLWLETMEANGATVGLALSELETASRSGFESFESPDLIAKLQAVESLAENLPPELRTAAAARYNLVRAAGQQTLANRRQQSETAAKTLVTRWTNELARIDPKGPATAASEILEPATSELAPFLDLAVSALPGVALSPAIAETIEEISAKIRSAQDILTGVASAQSELKHATTPAVYRAALAQLADCEYAEGVAAKRVLAAWPSDAGVQAELLFKGDLAAFEAATADAQGPLPLPLEVSPKDREIIEKLTTSEVLNDLWEVVWKNGKGKEFACLSRGAVVRNGKEGWKGRFSTYPQLASASLVFQTNTIPGAGGNILVVNRPTATAALMTQLKLGALINPNGISFRTSVLPLLDKVANDKQAKPLAKAYILGQLFDIVENHPAVEWGLHYCPKLMGEIKAFRALEMKTPLLEAAWLLKEEPDYAKLWEEYFATRGSTWGIEQMSDMRAAAAAVLRHTVDLAGRVSPDGTIELPPATTQRLLLAIRDTGDGKAKLGVVGIAPARAETFTLDPPALPYSPLLTLDLTDQTQAFLMSLHASNPVATPLPYPP